jgi:predicted Fe-Mo cluster-binding NifX family protein
VKIAAVSEDGVTISQHFGRAPFYIVLTMHEGQIIEREKRAKLGHKHFAGEPHEPETSDQPHGFSPSAQDRHIRMTAAITDCQVLQARGMGSGAYESLRQAGIRPIVTDIPLIEEAVQAYVEGRIIDQKERLH